MKANRNYLVAVALLAVLAVVFGLAGTVTPMSQPAMPQQESSLDSVTHFTNPPTYDSGWIDVRNRAGQYVSLTHGLNTTEVIVDITGKQSLDPLGGALGWSRTYGGTGSDAAESVVQTSDGGYALAGQTLSYGTGGDFWLVKTDQAGNKQWNQTYGGTGYEVAISVVQTLDGGYALAGLTDSFGAGGYDAWLVKTDSGGNIVWSQTYGGVEFDTAESVVQTSDGGYALAGATQSFGAGHYDFWLVKTDQAGNHQWNQTYGGVASDFAYSVVQTSDGGCALAGQTQSFGAGPRDFWLVKTNAAGNKQWNQTYGGVEFDAAKSVVQTSDGGYALAGNTNSFGAGGYDAWLVKTDSDGNMQWNQTCGGTDIDVANSVVQTIDGGYTLAGQTESFGAGGYDAWLVKTDSDGNMQWNQTYGGTSNDNAHSVVQTSDGGCALAGNTLSFGPGSADFWLVKVNVEMNLEHQRNLGLTVYTPGWSKTYGGTQHDFANSIVHTGDGGYVLVGHTESFGAGGGDFWLVKTDWTGNVQWTQTYGSIYDEQAFSVVQTSDGGYAITGRTGLIFIPDSWDLWLVKTDSAGNVQWNQTYGGTGDDVAWSVVQTGDGGYAIAGYTTSFGAGGGDFWLVKTDSTGNMQWNQTYGGTGDDWAWSLVQTSDEGYALAGETQSFAAGYNDFWLVRTDAAGNMQWNQTYGGTGGESAWSVVQTFDGGYAIAGYTTSFGAGSRDFWLVKADSGGTVEWNQTYGGTYEDTVRSVIQTGDGGYAIGGWTDSFGAGYSDSWLVKTDSAGNRVWGQTYGGAGDDYGVSVVQTSDGGYAIAGGTNSFGAGYDDFWLVKTDVEMGLAWTGLTNYTITLYRGRTDPYWNYVRVRIWTIEEPTWQFGDINQDGVVDAKDLAIIGQNYGKTFSALSIGGIVAIAGIYTYKKRKQPK